MVIDQPVIRIKADERQPSKHQANYYLKWQIEVSHIIDSCFSVVFRKSSFFHAHYPQKDTKSYSYSYQRQSQDLRKLEGSLKPTKVQT